MKGADEVPWKTVVYRPYLGYNEGWRIRKDHAGVCGRDASKEINNSEVWGPPNIKNKRKPNPEALEQ